MQTRHRLADSDPASEARQLLRDARTIAVVGLSSDPDKASAQVASYLHSAGYRIIPVHPTMKTWRGGPVYAKLADVTEHVDIVDVFRPVREAPEIARRAVAIKAGALWLQLGIECEEAASIARAAGVAVVMDRCTKIENMARVRDLWHLQQQQQQ